VSLAVPTETELKETFVQSISLVQAERSNTGQIAPMSVTYTSDAIPRKQTLGVPSGRSGRATPGLARLSHSGRA